MIGKITKELKKHFKWHQVVLKLFSSNLFLGRKKSDQVEFAKVDQLKPFT